MDDFESSRLRVALGLRGMNQRQLAEQCGVSPQQISSIVRGVETPSAELVTNISHTLRIDLEFFFGDQIDLFEEKAVSFRSLKNITAPVRNAGLGYSHIAASIIYPDLERRFHLPEMSLPDLSAHKPEVAAHILRREWELGTEPIPNMVHLLEYRGVAVFWLWHEDRALDGLSFWRDQKPFIMLNSLKQAGDRARMDAAHELGHLVLHRQLNHLQGRDAEEEAFKFASAFLMPPDRFRAECPPILDINRLYRLKARWRVSVAAMILRASDLGIYTDSQKQYAFRKLNARGELKKELANFSREESKLHRLVFESLEAKNITPEDYAASLHIPLADLLLLMPVAEGFFASLEEKTPKRYGHLTVISGGRSH